METIREIFDYYDTGNNGFINECNFKQLINVLGLPINNITDKNYNYDDLNNYIYNNATKKNKEIEKDKVHEVLNNYLNNSDTEFIINDLFKNQKLTNITSFELLNYSNIIQDQKIPQ